MITLKQKLVTAIATGALLTNALAPIAFAETTIEISGNGSKSDSNVNVTQSSNTTVVQNNTANVTNNVSGDAKTGGNDANDNTGGDVIVKTGNATSNATVSNTLNSNQADVANCNCEGDTKVTVSGNGSDSDNYVKLKNSNNNSVFQTNKADVYNNVDTDAKTGGNDANRNTGGDTVIMTGNAQATSNVSTAANANSAKVGGSNGNGGKLTAIISGNGANSDNDIHLYLDQDVVLKQDNNADIDNVVDANATTGYNDANDNTGGDVVIDTGWAKATANVDNMVNFNAADVDCGCLLDLKVKVDGNGYDSDNDVKAKISDNKELFQGNLNDTNNDVDADAKTGHNDADRNTGDVYNPSDPYIQTGNAETTQNVENSGNANVIGSGATVELPSGTHVNFNFDMNMLLAIFGLHMGQS
jgi:hypothetical protein